MRKERPKRPKIKQDPRTEKVTVLLSEEECKMLNYYVKKYKCASRSALMRKIVMTHVLEQLNANYPTLFDQAEDENK
ncbi:MAG: hypothetical protein Q4E10_02730 [Porphyromonas sp.]|nr:hypothetical protein [Porphyromonas sp.]